MPAHYVIESYYCANCGVLTESPWRHVRCSYPRFWAVAVVHFLAVVTRKVRDFEQAVVATFDPFAHDNWSPGSG